MYLNSFQWIHILVYNSVYGKRDDKMVNKIKMLMVPVIQPKKKEDSLEQLLYINILHGMGKNDSSQWLVWRRHRNVCVIPLSHFLSLFTSLKRIVHSGTRFDCSCSAEFDLATCVVCLLFGHPNQRKNKIFDSSLHHHWILKKKGSFSFDVITINSFES